MACIATRYGQIERSSQRACDITIASAMPMTMAMTSPISDTRAVQYRPCSSAVRLRSSMKLSLTTRCGAVMRNFGLPQMCVKPQYDMKYQKPMNPPKPMTGAA